MPIQFPKQSTADRYRPVMVQKDLAEGLKALRHEVENQGKGQRIVLVGQTYKTPLLNEVKILNYPPWEIGYKVEPIDIHQGMFKRTIYLKIKGEDILEIPEEEREPLMGAIFQELIDIGNEMPDIDCIATDCIRLQQSFFVMFWHEGNPNLIVPGTT